LRTVRGERRGGGGKRRTAQVKEEVVGVRGLDVEVEGDDVRVVPEGAKDVQFSLEKFGELQGLLWDHLHGQLGGGGLGWWLKVGYLEDCGVGTTVREEGGGKTGERMQKSELSQSQSWSHGA